MLYNVFQYVLAGLALVLTVSAVLVRGKRGVLAWAAISAAIAAIGAHYHGFWAVAVFSISVPWALVCAGDWIDFSWRLRAGFCVFLALVAGMSIYPTYFDERYSAPDLDPKLTTEQQAEVDAKAKVGDLGFARFIRSNVPFRLVRGLDLKGGLRLVYNVDVQEAIKDKRDRYFDEIRTNLAKSFGFAKEGERPTNDDLAKLAPIVKVEKAKDDVGKLIVTFENPADASKINDEFLKRFIGEMTVLRSADKKSATFRIKQEVEATVRDSAVAQAKDKVLRRIDGLGLKEAAVSTRDEDIIIEVPGNDERQFAEIRDIISQTARLEFKMLDDDVDFFGPIVKTTKEDSLKGLRFQPENAPVGAGKNKVVMVAYLRKGDGESMRDSLKRFQEWTSTLSVPDTHQIAFGKWNEYNEEKSEFEEVGWRTYYVQSRADVIGDMIQEASARAEDKDGTAHWVVSMEFSPLGADRFEETTGKNIGRRFAIILDDKVESAPVIQGKIGGGSAVITMGSGNQQQQLADSKKLELVLKSGALPAPISMSNQQMIGPSLGTDAIFQGLKGAAGGGILVLILMVTIYSRAGIIANLAVLFNLVLQVAILAMFGASMTLPGIAGLALTIGIAVDANVLINERIRDELRAGKSSRAAVDIGYDRAFAAILDGHVTTLISGLILMQYGTGPIKGFAVTLIVGVIVSLFTGVVCTRLMFDWAVRWRKVKKLSLG
jgi:preprotein translocase subunit SecD